MGMCVLNATLARCIWNFLILYTEEEAVNQSLLTLEPVSDDIRLTTTQDEWNFDDQRVSTDTVSFI